MQYSTYLFDLDGTLYSRDELVGRLIAAQHREFQAELSHIEPRTYIDRVIQLDAHGYGPKEQLYAELAAQWDLSPSLQARLLAHFWDTYDSLCELPEDTLTTLRALNRMNARLGIVTNGRADRQGRKIDALGIREYFDVVLISETEGLKKPHPDIFHRASQRCGNPLQDTVFIGDHPTVDIDGARDAGLAAIWRKVPYWEMARKDVRVVDQLVEILS